MVQRERRRRHWGTEPLYKGLVQDMRARSLRAAVLLVTQQCDLCLQTPPKAGRKKEPGQILKANEPGMTWQMDFTELPGEGGYRYLLVMTNTFSGWPEEPTRPVR